MSIILHTESLTKSRHFLAASRKLLWQNKKVFFALAALPIIFNFLGDFLQSYSTMYRYTLPSNSSSVESISIPALVCSFIEFFIVSTFTAVAWSRFLLEPNYKLTLKSYFCVDRKFWKYTLYFILAGLLYLISMLVPLLIGGTFLATTSKIIYWYTLVGVFLVTLTPIGIALCYLFPSALIFPAIALDKPAAFWQTMKKASPYRRSLFWSTLVLFLIAVLFGALFQGIANLPAISFFNLLPAIVESIISYLVEGLLWSLFALYYKKYRMK